MTTEDADGLVLAMAAELVRLHEGWRQRAYDDATGEPLRPGHTLVGNPTVGWGRNLRDVGIRRHEAEILLAEDLKEAIGRARSFAGSVWDGLSVERRSVLTDMAFNLGGRLMSFRRFRAACCAATSRWRPGRCWIPAGRGRSGAGRRPWRR